MVNVENILVVFLALIAAIAVHYYSRRIWASLTVGLFLLAGAGIYIIMPGGSERTVLLLDRSESMVIAPNLPKDVQADQIIEFGSDTGKSDIEAALYQAAAWIKTNGRVVLYSDLLETQGDISIAARELASAGIALEVLTPYYYRDKEVILSDVILPPYITYAQNVTMEILIESGSDTKADLEIKDLSNNTTENRAVELKAGLNRFYAELNTAGSEISYYVAIKAVNDTDNINNQRHINARIYDRPGIGVIGRDSEQASVTAALSKYATVSAWQAQSDYELIILADWPGSTIDNTIVTELDRQIRSGTGLLVLPGENIIRNNMLSDPALNELMPADIASRLKKSSPDGCIVFIVDTSGSMEGARLILAREIVRSSVSRLQAHDKVGIVEFYGNRKWSVPIQYASGGLELNREINRLTAGGGTVILPAIEEAYYGLLNTQASARHIVVITDGGIETGNYEALLRRISDDNINVSFVLAGPAANVGFLADMAVYGGGKFLHAPDRFSIPAIDIKTLSNDPAGLFQDSSEPLTVADNLLWPLSLSGESNTSVTKFIPVTLKPAAAPVLNSGVEPVLSFWHYGLGKVLLCSSDILSEDKNRVLLQDLCREMYRQPEDIEMTKSEEQFEIRACQPDKELSQQLNHSTPQRKIQSVQAITLDKYFILAALVMFLAGIIRRRLPIRQTAVLIMLIMGLQVHADLPADITQGINCFYSGEDKAVALFESAVKQATDPQDKKYALGWLILAADKFGQFDQLEQRLRPEMDYITLTTLNKAYAFRGDFQTARHIYDDIAGSNSFNAEQRGELDRQLMEIAQVSGDLAAVSDYYHNRNDILTRIKIMMLQGDGRQAAGLIDTIDISLSSTQLLDISRSISQMSFNTAAIRLADEVLQRNDQFSFEAAMLLADLYRKTSQEDQYQVILEQTLARPGITASQKYDIALQLEADGHIDQAIEIHRQLIQGPGALDSSLRIAQLLRMTGKLQEAYNYWLELWQQNDDAFVLYQVIPGLLDAATRSGQLADLAISLEDELKDQTISEKELDLLLNIYTSTGDSFTPIELVKQYYGDDSLAGLQKQYDIYRRCQMLRHCSRILARLSSANPTQAPEYLRQAAMLALERQDSEGVEQIIGELSREQEEGDLEFFAGVYSLLGETARARDIYARLLEKEPDNYELWLSWSQQVEEDKPESREFAIGRISELLTAECPAELFVVAADCLLNLDAPVEMLSRAYQLTMERLAADPGRIVYYRLATDLLTETDPQADVPLILQAATHARQGRTIYVREAMNQAGAFTQRRFELIELLVYMDLRSSPAEYLEYGKQFMAAGQEKAAEYLFRSNSLLSGENKGLYLEIAGHYQAQGRFNEALAFIREALAMYPTDIELLTESGCIREIMGQYDQAYQDYLAVWQQLDCITAGPEYQPESKNVDLEKQVRAVVIDGLIVTSSGELPDKIQEIQQARLCQQATEPAIEYIPAPTLPQAGPKSATDQMAISQELIDLELQTLLESSEIDGKFYRRIDELLANAKVETLEYLYQEYSDYAAVVGEKPTLLWINATLARLLGHAGQAQKLIARCFVLSPQNRLVEFELKEIYEDAGLYGQAAVILENAAQYNQQSPNYWREIVRLYYLAGDLEKARHANRFAAVSSHYILAIMDNLLLAYTANDQQALEQYFRKYQVDCRKNGRYFALKWNSWDRDKLKDDQPYQYETIYQVLARVPQLQDEFIRYSRVIYPQRRDHNQFNKAFEQVQNNNP